MAIVQSFGALQTFADPTPAPVPPFETGPRSGGTVTSALASADVYAAIFSTQPHVRTVVEFLARNIAQLSIHAFRRVSDLDRTRLSQHQLIQWLDKPNPHKCRYRLIEDLMYDLGIYFNAYWLKVRRSDRSLGLVRLPPAPVRVEGWLLPKAYVWTLPDGRELTFAPSELVVFNGYNPFDPLMGLSPIETLRQILAEDCAATSYREAFWTNAARLEGVITRPKEAPKWTLEQKQSFREQWQARFSGQPGQTAVLEDGMSFTATSYNARDSQLSEARKLTREEVAAAYHIPLPMVGILDHATFSNIKEQHKQLYQDCLGPWLQLIVEELERQLLVECEDQDDVYLEFNINDKLKGSFEEQAQALQTFVGRPLMTVNEGRARLNLPSIKDDPTTDQVAMPLNTTTTPGTPGPAEEAQRRRAGLLAVIQRNWFRQRANLEKVPPAARADAFTGAGRWDHELASDLCAIYRAQGLAEDVAVKRAIAIAVKVNADTAAALAADQSPAAIFLRAADRYLEDAHAEGLDR